LEWISKIIEIAKLPTKFILSIFAVSVVLLFLPKNLLISLYVNEFTDKYGIYIGITALMSGVLLIVEIFTYFYNMLQKRINRKTINKRSLKRIETLDQEEKAVLREFFLRGRNTVKLPKDHPVVEGLLHSGILKLVGSYGRMSSFGMLYSMEISNLIREDLIYEIIGMPNGEPTEQEIEFLRSNRPEFMLSIEREELLFG